MENIQSMSLVEIAIEIQSKNTEPIKFKDLYDKVCEVKGFTEEEARSHIAQFYTDITASGDFLYCGEEKGWDLKRNQPLDVLDKEYENEHTGSDIEEDLQKEKEEAKQKRRARRKQIKTVEEQEEEDNKEDFETEDQGYETQMGASDDYDQIDEEDFSSHEEDFDSELDDYDDQEYDDEDEGFDEDSYMSTMDEFEDLYDK